MILQTQRLHLREFVWGDLEAVYAYQSDPLAVQHLCSGPATREDCGRELALYIAQQAVAPRLRYALALALPASAEALGCCSLKLDSARQRQGELGYILRRAAWGHGYMTEAARALLAFGFEQLGLERVIATCNPANTASIRVLERLGMRYEGLLPQKKWCKGQWRDTSRYALPADEWRARRGG